MSDFLTACRSIREALLAHLGEHMEVSASNSHCVITLPLKTLDDRFLDVYVDQTVGDFVVVHDGGNAIAELFMQGIHMTDARLTRMRQIARRYGASFDGDKFLIATHPSRINEAVLALAQCSSLAMYDVLRHQPFIEEEPVAVTVRKALETYRPLEVDTQYRVPLKGVADADHILDAVVIPRTSVGRRTVAVKTLGTAYPSNVQAHRYGFLALDLKGTAYGRWPLLAVIAKSERWRVEDLELVRRLSTDTVELRSGEEPRLPEILPAEIDKLAA